MNISYKNIHKEFVRIDVLWLIFLVTARIWYTHIHIMASTYVHNGFICCNAEFAYKWFSPIQGMTYICIY